MTMSAPGLRPTMTGPRTTMDTLVQLFRAAFDRKAPGALALALAAHGADPRFHDGEQEQVKQRNEQQANKK